MNLNQDKILLTREGLEALKKEYQKLTDSKRPKILELLVESRQAGDLAENSQYIQAREELSFVDGRISELEEVISKAALINENHRSCQKINLGCRVMVVVNGGKEQVFHLVGDREADPATRKISYTSPLGRSLLGKKIGDSIEIEAPVGKIAYTITKID